MYMKTLFIFLTLTFFSACGVLASSSSLNSSANHEWINNPPSDTAEYFYAVGYGVTQKDAKSDALATISAKISVNVASSFSSSVSASRQGDNEEVLSNTKNEVLSKSKDIEYTDVKVEESFDDGKQWILLVEVERAILSATYERKLEKVDSQLQAEWEIFERAGFFEKLKLTASIEKYLKETDTFFALLHALNVSYDDSKYTQRYINYTKEMRKAKNELIFKINADKNSESLAALIRSQLSEQNAKFSDSNYNVLINVSTNAKEAKVNSTNETFKKLTIALRNTVIKATDKSGNIVSNVEYKTKEGSSEGFQDAISRTAKYEKKIAEIGIISFITGN